MDAVKGEELILKYLIREPSVKTKKPALVILLHGVGSNEQNMFQQAQAYPNDMLIISVRAPYVLGANSFAWFAVDFSSGRPIIDEEQAEKSRIVLRTFINQVVERYEADGSQVYLVGFSQGAIMCYSAALTYPEKIAGIAALSGRLLPEVKPLTKDHAALQHLRIFVAHGTLDNVLNVDYARSARHYLEEEKGLVVTYKEYEIPHVVNNQVLTDLVKWIIE